MSSLIPVVSDQINGKSVLTVDARELHVCLGVATKFQDWIVRRIHEFGFMQDTDFRVILKFENDESRFGGTVAIKEYRLSLDMAKELAMVERTEKGRMVRRYFIDCERLARSQHADLTRLQTQLAACHAELLQAKPVWGKIARYKRLGLNHVEIGLLTTRHLRNVRRNVRRIEACGLLPTAAPQMALTLEG